MYDEAKRDYDEKVKAWEANNPHTIENKEKKKKGKKQNENSQVILNLHLGLP